MSRLALGLALSLSTVVTASAEEVAAGSRSAGLDVFASSDADDTAVRKTGLTFDWDHAGPAEYQGLRLERAVFKPLGQSAETDLRVYYRFADQSAGWSWKGQVGTDGDTVLGVFGVQNEDHWRQEYFLEREIVETPQGVRQGLYYTFAGGALDVPMDERNSATVVAAVQDFTGRNLRTHLRLTYVHLLEPEWGLTAQLRGRYFHSSRPGEFDYFSPRDFVQVIPTLQLRRRVGGWRYVLAAGLGAQHQTRGRWRPARAFSTQLTSPPANSGWSLEGAVAYSNTPVGAGYSYDYRQLTVGLRRGF